MRKTYLQVVLEHTGLNQAQLARKVGWTPQRVGYLTSYDCKGFPFPELWHLKKSLNLSDNEQIRIFDEYFGQYNGFGRLDGG